MIDIKDIRKLQSIFSGEDIDEIEIRHGKEAMRITIGTGAKKTAKAAVKDAGTQAPETVEAPQGQVPAANPAAQESEQSSVYELRSQWIGFFTRLNPKTGENYIKLRDVVKKGEIVGHVRVLGVLQDLKSEVKGKVKEVLIEEGQPIEYGQPVMRFEVQG